MDREPFADLSFRERMQRGPRRQQSRRSGLVWVVVAIIAALLFVLTIRALLQRTAWTAGASSAPVAESLAVGHMDRGTTDATPDYLAPPAAMVYRCVDGAGGVSLQSQPCDPGQRTTRAVPVPRYVEPPRSRADSRPAASHRQTYAYASPSASDQQRAQREARCAIARNERAQTLERIGLKRTYDLLQRLDAMVSEACKGV